MKCWKCKEEMFCMTDSNWKEYRDGEKRREAEFMCPGCRVYIEFWVSDYSECDLEDE